MNAYILAAGAMLAMFGAVGQGERAEGVQWQVAFAPPPAPPKDSAQFPGGSKEVVKSRSVEVHGGGGHGRRHVLERVSERTVHLVKALRPRRRGC